VNLELLKELVEAPGVSGQEDQIRAIVRRELSKSTTITSDSMGNVICLEKLTPMKLASSSSTSTTRGFSGCSISGAGIRAKCAASA
jgi:hypothetical protein